MFCVTLRKNLSGVNSDQCVLEGGENVPFDGPALTMNTQVTNYS